MNTMPSRKANKSALERPDLNIFNKAETRRFLVTDMTNYLNESSDPLKCVGQYKRYL